MNKILCLSFLASVAMMPSGVMAMPKDSSPTSSSTIIVEQALLDKSAAVQDIAKKMEKKREEIQKELANYEKELKKQDEELTKQQKELSEKTLSEEEKKKAEEAFTKKRQAFEKRVREIQDKIEIRRAQMELAVEDAKKQVFEVFLKIAHEERKAKGASIMSYKETVVDADPNLDVSTSVLQKLDKALPTVEIKFPSEAEVKKKLEKNPAQ